MGDQTGALPIADISKANFYGQSADAQQELIDANENAIKALQQRYENPNWFNVAAGFFKPQLGGFAASLGSAAQAMGENLEKQRANELPVAQYRAQVALMKNQMVQNQKANEMLAAANGVITPDLVREMEVRVGKDHPTVLAAKAQLETQQKQQVIDQTGMDIALKRLTAAMTSGSPVSAELYTKAGLTPPSDIQTAGGAGANTKAPAPIGVSSDHFIDATHNIENPANLPKGAAPGTAPQQGPGQFTEDTLKKVAAKYPNVGKPEDYGKPGKEDTTRAFDSALLADNHASLAASGNKAPTTLDHRLAWHFGAGVANKLNQLDENTPIGAVLTTKNANGDTVPNLDLLQKNNLKPSMTVKELKDQEANALASNGVNANVPLVWGESPSQTVATNAPTRGTRAQDIEAAGANTKMREAPFEQIATDWGANAIALPEQKNRIFTMTNLLDGNKAVTDKNGNTKLVYDPNLKLTDAFDTLRQQGTLGAVLNAAQEGVQAHTPWGTIALSLPVQKALASLNLSPAQQQRFGQFTMLLAQDRLEQGNLRQFGAHPNQAEFAASQSVSPQPFDPSANLHSYLEKRAANLHYQDKAHEALLKWRETSPPEALISRFFSSEPHRNLLAERNKALNAASYTALQ